MERKSSLDLFRGSADSSFFSDLNFLEELPHDPAPVSEAVPSTLPLQQIPANQAVPIKHNRSPYHSSAALINAWPQASGRLSSQAYNRPISFPDTFLPLSNSSATRAGHSDSHPDSSSALLNDDTALGFADDCFRRESDLFLSQERTLQHDAVVINQTPPNTDSTDPAGTGEHQCCLTADLAQQLPTQGSTVSYPQAAAAAAADRKPTCSADIQASGASMQAPNSSSAEHEEGSDAFQGLQKSVSVQAADQSAELHSPHAHNTHVAETEQQQTQLPKPGTADNTNSNVDGHGALLVPKATSVKDRVAAEGAFIKAPTLAQHISSPADVLRPQASTVPAAETSLSQGVQAFEHGQASKPKLAVQDYRPDDAQASQTGIAELQSKPQALQYISCTKYQTGCLQHASIEQHACFMPDESACIPHLTPQQNGRQYCFQPCVQCMYQMARECDL